MRAKHGPANRGGVGSADYTGVWRSETGLAPRSQEARCCGRGTRAALTHQLDRLSSNESLDFEALLLILCCSSNSAFAIVGGTFTGALEKPRLIT